MPYAYKPSKLIFNLFCLLFGFLINASSYALEEEEIKKNLRGALTKHCEEYNKGKDESEKINLDYEIDKIIHNLNAVIQATEATEATEAVDDDAPKTEYLKARLVAYNFPQVLLAELCIAGPTDPKMRDKDSGVVHTGLRGQYAGLIALTVSQCLNEFEKAAITPPKYPDKWDLDAETIQSYYSVHTQLGFWGLTGPKLPTSDDVPLLFLKMVEGKERQEEWVSKTSFKEAVDEVLLSLGKDDGKIAPKGERKDNFEELMKLTETPLYDDLTLWLPERNELKAALEDRKLDISDYWDEEDFLNPDLLLALLNWPKKQHNYKSLATLVTCVIVMKATGKTLYEVKPIQNLQTMGKNRETPTYRETDDNKENPSYMIALCLHNLKEAREAMEAKETKEAKEAKEAKDKVEEDESTA